MKSKTISDPYTEINAVLLDYFNCYVFNVILRLLFSKHMKLKGIVHPKMKIWCLSAYPQGIRDVGDFVSSVD